MKLTIDTDSEDYEKRVKAAGDRAEWELGSRSYAGDILGAFFYPDEDKVALDKEKE